jgi:hypothetical protein
VKNLAIIEKLLNHPSTLSFYSVSRNKHGDVIPTSVYTGVKCRWDETTNIVTNRDGQEIVSNINVWILPSYTILEDYEVVKDSKTYKIVGMETKYSIFGIPDHIRLYLK